MNETPTPQQPPSTLPDDFGQISPEEERRRRMVAEQIARAYGKKHPDAAPAGERKPHFLDKWKRSGGILGAIATALFAASKYALIAWKFVFASKLIITFGSMAISIVLEAWQFGWPFAIGIVSVVFIHECGHAVASLMKGIPMRGIILIPFMGGVAIRERRGKTAAEDAFIGIMGPVFGLAAGLVCWALWAGTHERFFAVMTLTVMVMHLFNMAPVFPLDGSKVLPLFSPKLLLIGMAGLLVVGFLNPMVLLLAFMGAPCAWAQWKAKPSLDPYYRRVTLAQRIGYGVIYAGMTTFFALSSLYLFTQVLHQAFRLFGRVL